MVMKSGYELTQKLLSVPLLFYDTRFAGELSQKGNVLLRYQQYDLPEHIGLYRINYQFIISHSGCCSGASNSCDDISGIIIVNYFVLRYMLRSRLDANVTYSIVQAQATAITLQGISNIQVLKACGAEFDFLERWLNSTLNLSSRHRIFQS